MHFITLGCLILSIMSLARPLLTHIALQLLIIAHQGILRIIYAFYMGKSRAEAPYLSIPLNCVVELVPGPFDCKETVMHSTHPSFMLYFTNYVFSHFYVFIVRRGMFFTNPRRSWPSTAKMNPTILHRTK